MDKDQVRDYWKDFDLHKLKAALSVLRLSDVIMMAETARGSQQLEKSKSCTHLQEIPKG